MTDLESAIVAVLERARHYGCCVASNAAALAATEVAEHWEDVAPHFGTLTGAEFKKGLDSDIVEAIGHLESLRAEFKTLLDGLPDDATYGVLA